MISTYIPQVRSPFYSYPLLVCNVEGIHDEALFDWNDPDRDYTDYDLTKDAKKLIHGLDLGKKVVFSQIKHWPPEESQYEPDQEMSEFLAHDVLGETMATCSAPALAAFNVAKKTGQLGVKTSAAAATASALAAKTASALAAQSASAVAKTTKSSASAIAKTSKVTSKAALSTGQLAARSATKGVKASSKLAQKSASATSNLAKNTVNSTKMFAERSIEAAKSVTKPGIQMARRSTQAINNSLRPHSSILDDGSDNVEEDEQVAFQEEDSEEREILPVNSSNVEEEGEETVFREEDSSEILPGEM